MGAQLREEVWEDSGLGLSDIQPWYRRKTMSPQRAAARGRRVRSSLAVRGVSLCR